MKDRLSMKATALFILFGLSIWLFGCATTEETYQGAGIAGAVGAAAGALIDKDNRWRGAVIGGALGAE